MTNVMECKCCKRKDLTEDDFYWRKGLGIKTYADCRVCVSKRITKKYHDKENKKPNSIFFDVEVFGKFYAW